MDAVTLCNLALDQISSTRGGNQITSLSPPLPVGTNSQVAARNYQLQTDAVFRAAHWNSARGQVALTLLRAAVGTPENPSGLDPFGNTLPVPPIPWLYEYAQPPDCLAVRFVIPQPPAAAGIISTPLMTGIGVMNIPLVNTSMPFVPAIDRDKDGNQIKVILTNAENAQAVYTMRVPNIDLWDASLQNAVVGTLAAWFCLPVTGDKSLMQMRVGLAVGLINAARMSDGNEGITTTDHEPDFMRARNAGLSFGNTLIAGGPFIAGWSSLGMPDGVSY